MGLQRARQAGGQAHLIPRPSLRGPSAVGRAGRGRGRDRGRELVSAASVAGAAQNPESASQERTLHAYSPAHLRVFPLFRAFRAFTYVRRSEMRMNAIVPTVIGIIGALSCYQMFAKPSQMLPHVTNVTKCLNVNHYPATFKFPHSHALIMYCRRQDASVIMLDT